MELNYFKDHLFDLLNESDLLDVQDITSDEKRDLFRVTVHDGTQFNVYCRVSNRPAEGEVRRLLQI